MIPAASRTLLFVFLSMVSMWAQTLTPKEARLANATDANELKAHVSFLASDALEGRDTPSPGLDVAAEYIAAQFRRFGLQTLDNGTYFQYAPFATVRQPMDGFELTLEGDGKTLRLDKGKATMTSASALQLQGLDVVRVSITEANTLPAKESIAGKAVLLQPATARTRAMLEKRQALLSMGAKVVVTTGPSFSGVRLRAEDTNAHATSPLVTVSDASWSELIANTADGATLYKLSGNIPAPVETKVTLRNVIGVLPGSDPVLKDTYVLLSAHYDHVGTAAQMPGDNIFNGANDDASGVATVLELARVLSEQQERPKRTLVFAMWFGEEKGLLGSRYYVKHPAFPVVKTVANLNFEHMGRTDDSEGPKVSKLTASGFDFSDVGDVLSRAGTDTGVEVWKHPENSDAFFGRSDNQALADAGVPAHTICVAWLFPDYHRPGDHWDKIDYDNMAKVTGTLAVAAWRVGENDAAPRWHESNPKTARYVEAWKRLTSAGTHAGSQE